MTTTPRILTDAEYDAAYARLTDAAYRHGSRLGTNAAHDVLTETLAAVGLFAPAPEPDLDTCTAQYLPTDIDLFGPDLLGQWQQCTDEPGHADHHDSIDLVWGDDSPGALPARA
ncbi:hypothetical protein I5Q34_07405 [Streptomyces sp. AV19]|uniref:hypothetical protein n=1 Tax=Streptomyces sp. AV19 TaxID=2793068 RepID=UPI0018FE9886|nr:hypothetical protein [Streptomyces sp. AV19]MBH1934122.1 hypothetical protein [Streptomyces sp. AV19]MDG4537156.1 hypothetical protein [Streptomyces sp. AV19]